MEAMSNTRNFQHDSVDDFNSNNVENNMKYLRIAQWNIRGMNELKKFDNIALFLDNCAVSIDIFVIGETWLKSDNCSLYKIPEYNAVFSCRESSSGGLAMFIKNTHQYTIIKNQTFDGFHMIQIELQMKGVLYDVVGIYRSPSFEYNRFQDVLENLLSNCRRKPCFIVGDMNVPTNLSSNNVVLRYKNLLESYDFVCSNS